MTGVKLEKRFCAFLDILGFKEIVKENGDADEACAKVVDALKAGLRTLEYPLSHKLVDVKSFSDNLLFSLKYNIGSKFVVPMFEFVCKYQRTLIQSGYFVRGGISLGGLYIDDHAIYGEALVEAYEIESLKAINPVVMLSRDVLEFAKSNEHMGVVSQVFNGKLCRSYIFEFNGQCFVNYLRSAFVPVEDPDAVGILPTELDVEFMRFHRDAVILNLEKYSENRRVYEKYLFLAAYHNAFCDACAGDSEANEELKIKTSGYDFKFLKGF